MSEQNTNTQIFI